DRGSGGRPCRGPPRRNGAVVRSSEGILVQRSDGENPADRSLRPAKGPSAEPRVEIDTRGQRVGKEAAMTLTMGKRELEMGGPHLGELRDATALRGDPAALRQWMAEDGYLLIRGLHDREKVLAVRHRILAALDANDQIDRS